MHINEANKLLQDLPKLTSLSKDLQQAYRLILMALIGGQIGVTDDDLANESLETRELYISELEKQRTELSDAFTKILSTIDVAMDAMR